MEIKGVKIGEQTPNLEFQMREARTEPSLYHNLPTVIETGRGIRFPEKGEKRENTEKEQIGSCTSANKRREKVLRVYGLSQNTR